MKKILLSVFALSFIAISCSDSPNNSAIPNGNEPSLQTRCGVIYDGQVLNPISGDSGMEVYGASIVDSNIYRVTLDRRTELVYLHGTRKANDDEILDFEASDSLQQTLENILSNETNLFLPFNNSTCKVSTPYGEAILGNIVSRSGQSLSEELLEDGELLAADGNCGEELIKNCYEGIVQD